MSFFFQEAIEKKKNEFFKIFFDISILLFAYCLIIKILLELLFIFFFCLDKFIKKKLYIFFINKKNFNKNYSKKIIYIKVHFNIYLFLYQFLLS